MKCEFENCENEACKKVRRKIISGPVTKKTFNHCGKHTKDEIDRHISCQGISMQMQNPMCDVKNLIKKP